MVKIGDWGIRIIPQGHALKVPNYEEKYFLYFKENVIGSLLLCDFDKDWWARILMERIRKKFYSDYDKFYKKDIIRSKKGKISVQKINDCLIKELVKWVEIEKEIQNYDKDFYCRVFLGSCFDKVYYDKVSDKEIISDIKAELPRISETLSDKQIKKSIIKIFQFQELNFDLKEKSCKRRKYVKHWIYKKNRRSWKSCYSKRSS
ncbi:MAG: hypothetical protein J6J36_02920 [Clostridia bacterium]|nr:hypothetical protein [Clostridia bacterium]